MRDNRKPECATICLPDHRLRGLPMELTAVLTPAEEGGFVAFNPETGTTTQGETVEEAIANLPRRSALGGASFRCTDSLSSDLRGTARSSVRAGPLHMIGAGRATGG